MVVPLGCGCAYQQHRQTRPCLLSLPEQTKEPEIIAAYAVSGQISLAKTGRLQQEPHETRFGEMTRRSPFALNTSFSAYRWVDLLFITPFFITLFATNAARAA
jgi:hypothetical protein